jgi:hypothetical protein
MATDLTVEILREIRDGITALRTEVSERIEGLRVEFAERLDQNTQRLDLNNQRLERVEHGLNDLGKFMRQIALDQAKHERFHTHHVDLLEADVTDLKSRVRRLEERAEP